jgi:hypothetical protein
MSAEAARQLEDDIAFDNTTQGEGDPRDEEYQNAALVALRKTGVFARTLDGGLLFYRHADRKLYEVSDDPRSAFGRHLKRLFPSWTPEERGEAVEVLRIELGEAAPVMKVTLTDAHGGRRTRPAHFARKKKYTAGHLMSHRTRSVR